MNKEIPGIERLNAIQAEWMELDSNATEKEKRRVFALMELIPNIYVSGHDGKGVCIAHNQPCSVAVDFSAAMDRCRAMGGRADIAWNGTTSQWYRICPHCGGTCGPLNCLKDGHGG